MTLIDYLTRSMFNIMEKIEIAVTIMATLIFLSSRVARKYASYGGIITKFDQQNSRIVLNLLGLTFY